MKRFGLVHPATLKITTDAGEQKSFEDPKEAEEYISRYLLAPGHDSPPTPEPANEDTASAAAMGPVVEITDPTMPPLLSAEEDTDRATVSESSDVDIDP